MKFGELRYEFGYASNINLIVCAAIINKDLPFDALANLTDSVRNYCNISSNISETELQMFAINELLEGNGIRTDNYGDVLIYSVDLGGPVNGVHRQTILNVDGEFLLHNVEDYLSDRAKVVVFP